MIHLKHLLRSSGDPIKFYEDYNEITFEEAVKEKRRHTPNGVVSMLGFYEKEFHFKAERVLEEMIVAMGKEPFGTDLKHKLATIIKESYPDAKIDHLFKEESGNDPGFRNWG